MPSVARPNAGSANLRDLRQLGWVVERKDKRMKLASRRWPRGAAPALAALAIAVVLTAAAEAKVVLGQGIAGVSLGDTKSHVVHLFGAGKFCSSSGSETSCNYRGALEGRVSFNTHGRVVDLFTGSCKQRTTKRIHPGCAGKKGSSLKDIKRAYPHSKCTVTGGFASCSFFSRYHGRKVSTSFLIKSASFGVAEIEIGYAA